MAYDASDRKDIRKAEKAAKLANLQRGELVTQIMSTIPGRAWVYDRLESAHIFRTSFSPDPIQMAFNEGERSQGLQLLADVMAACPDQYVTMTREHNERRASSERSSSEDADGGDQESGSGDEGRSED